MYNTERFRNITVALNTPFTKDGALDLAATKSLSRYFLAKGVKSMYVCGSTGEGFLLSTDERRQTLDAVLDAVGGDMTIIAHVGAASTREAVLLAKHAGQAGAHATSAVPCVYYRPGEEGIYRHWTEITLAADIPFFIYNIPALTGYSLSMPLFQKMLENERVAGVKNSSEVAHDILRFKQAGGKDFIVFNGPDEQYLAGRMMGADAGIGGTYGAMPALYLKLEELIRKEAYDEAKKLQACITQFIYRLLAFPSLYGAVKALLTLDGCDVGIPRLPFLPVSTSDAALNALYQDIQQAILATKE